MAQLSKLSSLPVANQANDTDQIEANQGGTNRSVTVGQVKANLYASPTFTGNPTAPTPVLGDNDTSLATTAFVQAALNAATPGTAPTVTSVAVLKLMTVRPPLVFTQGYYVAGDGGGGPPWVWMAGSSATADDFMVVAPAGTPAGRYIRQTSGPVKTTWGGCQLAGSPADQSALFQNVVNYANANGCAIDMSGGNLPVQNIVSPIAGTCPGMFSDGSCVIVPPPGSTSTTSGIQINNPVFYVDRVTCVLPTSTTAGTPPTYNQPFQFANAKDIRISNFTQRGGFRGLWFSISAIGATGQVGNVTLINIEMTDIFGDTVFCDAPNNFSCTNSLFMRNGWDGTYTSSGGIRMLTGSTFTIGNNCLIANNRFIGNVPNGATVGQNGAIDFAGVAWRNAVIANNLMDNPGSIGQIEIKAFSGAVGTPIDELAVWNIIGNVNNVSGNVNGAFLMLNNVNNLVTNGKMNRVLVTGNYQTADTVQTAGQFVSIAPGWDNVTISGNKTDGNIYRGVQVANASVPGVSCNNIKIIGNDFAAQSFCIQANPGNVNGLHILGNELNSAIAQTVALNGSTITDLVVKGNDIVEQSAGTAAVSIAFSSGVVLGNRIACPNNGLCVQVTNQGPQTLLIADNDFNPGTSHVTQIDLVSATGVEVSNNRAVLANNTAFVNPSSGGSGYVTANNRRNLRTTTPQGVCAGSLGEIVTNSAAPAGGPLAWICTTAGTVAAAVWTAQTFP